MSELETRPAGGGVLQATVVGIGCNNFGRRLDAEATARVVLTALEEGITFFDTADTYGNGQSEEMLGAALKGRREEAVIATKFGHPSGGEGHSGASRRWIRIAVEGSLRRLGTDWIDLYQMHMPDPATPIEETLETLTELVSEGKVRCVGSSNLAGWQIADADWIEQNSWSHAVHQRAERVQPPQPIRRGGGHPRVRSLRRRHDSVQPARQRRAHGQTSPWTGSRPGTRLAASSGAAHRAG